MKYLDQGIVSWVVYIMSELIKLYTLNMCSLLYVNHTSIKLLQKEKGGQRGNETERKSYHVCWGGSTFGG